MCSGRRVRYVESEAEESSGRSIGLGHEEMSHRDSDKAAAPCGDLTWSDSVSAIETIHDVWTCFACWLQDTSHPPLLPGRKRLHRMALPDDETDAAAEAMGVVTTPAAVSGGQIEPTSDSPQQTVGNSGETSYE